MLHTDEALPTYPPFELGTRIETPYITMAHLSTKPQKETLVINYTHECDTCC